MTTLASLFDAAFLENPYPVYAELREAGPVHSIELLGRTWAFTRHADVIRLLKDPRLSARRGSALADQFGAEDRAQLTEFSRLFSMWMLFFDPPEHTRARAALARAFNPDAVEGLRGCIDRNVKALLDAIERRGTRRFDVVADLARPLPARVIADWMDVPSDDREDFVTWTDDIAEFFGASRATMEIARRAQESLCSLTAYCQVLLRTRTGGTGPDLISRIVASGTWSPTVESEALASQCAMLAFAGHETTRNLIGNGLLALLTDADAENQVRRGQVPMRQAVDEMLRYDSPVQFGTRLAAEDVDIAGARIRRGELIILLFGSANRDPKEFDRPDDLQLARTPNRHVSFGNGPHSCIGAALAHLEAGAAFTSVLERFPTLKLATRSLLWSTNFGFRGLRELPVQY